MRKDPEFNIASHDELQEKITSVSKMVSQEKGRQLNESIELADPLDKRIEEILRVKDEAPSLISYPSSESLYENLNQMK